MARNYEKNFSGLNRLWLHRQAKERESNFPSRPPLHKLRTAAEVKKWIPSIKKDITYCLDQLSGRRNYSEKKMSEFEQRLDDLKREYDRFVKKVFSLDPNTNGIPWTDRPYVGKRKAEQVGEGQAKRAKGSCDEALSTESGGPQLKTESAGQIVSPLLEAESPSCSAKQQADSDCPDKRPVSIACQMIGCSPLTALQLDYNSDSSDDNTS